MVLISLICAVVGQACGDNASRLLRTISLDPGSPRLAAGLQLDVKAGYVAADETTTEAPDVTWTVGDAAIATVTPGAGGRATLHGVNVGTTTLNVAGSGTIASFIVTVTPAVVTDLSIAPRDPSLAAGTSMQLTATGVFSDGTSMNVTKMVVWKTSAVATATVDGNGLLRGAVAGPVVVSATLAKVTAIANVTVTAATLRSIGVTPTDPNLPLGIHQQLTATGVFSDGSSQDITNQVTWRSDTEAHATVNATGVVTAVALGTAPIRAIKDGLAGTSRATVTPAVLLGIAVAPADPTLPLGSSLGFTATATFSDGPHDITSQAGWSVSPDGIATISNLDGSRGVARAVALGTATVTATFAGTTDSTSLTVSAAELASIDVTPGTTNQMVGAMLQYTATGMYTDGSSQDLTTQVEWASDDTTVAQIDAAIGRAVAIAAGSATISATFTTTAGAITGHATFHVPG